MLKGIVVKFGAFRSILVCIVLAGTLVGCGPVLTRASVATPAAGPVATPAAVAAPRSTAAPSQASPPDPLGGTGAGAIADVAAKVKPGVVQITNEQLTLNQLGQTTSLVPSGVGSGVIFDKDGHILTNNHVVAGAQKLTVSLPDGRSFPATLVGRDPHSDLAVIQIKGDNLPIIPLGDSTKLVVGQWVVAIGNALALQGGPTVTAGVVSALGRTVQEPPSSNGQAGPFLFDVIQTDAPINPGNSGGPLVNLKGQVVGINTLAVVQAEPGVPAQSVGFAIAIDTAKPIADELIATGHVTYAFLGVGLYPNSPAFAARFNLPSKPGMIVTDLVPNGPSAQAGVQQGDVITAIEGKPITDESTLSRILLGHKPGDKVSLTVARGSGQQTLTVTLGTAPSSS
ncbi:MAG: S1C family serine protease [Chloroflexota bacterium]